ncbi:MAG: cation-transporting P-type ATPase [Planctomycetes bacterium]|nr:cation-transporting P-type ATPase [Planctomycetota bacterium]
MPMAAQTRQPWATGAAEVAEALGVDPAAGLAADEARRRRERHGPNRLARAAGRSVGRILLEQFKSIVIIILALAAVLSLVFGDLPETVAIAAVILINGGIGFVSEWRATRSMEALRKIGRPHARVRRDGAEAQVDTEALVPGDVVILDAGDIAPADLRLVAAHGLTVDESALTGESVAVGKSADPVDGGVALADRGSMVYRGTTLVEGSAEAVVVATGMATELGRISQLTEEVQEELTPLERRLERLGRRMAALVFSAAAVIAVVGLLSGHTADLILRTAVALGVAAVPEGLPIVANLALARGMWLMARRHALINRLPAVETLGATDVVFTDKTGTLTQNRMTVRRVVTPAGDTAIDAGGAAGEGGDPLLHRALELGALCANASLPPEGAEDQQAQGDPTEIALLEAAAAFGLRRPRLLEEKPETREESFDPGAMMMATFHRAGGRFEVAVKGAPHAVLEACTTVAAAGGDRDEPLSDDRRRRWVELAEDLGDQGLRVLAVADRTVDDDRVEPYRDLRLVGLVGMHDPPSEGVRELIRSCREAGVRVIMVTGDHGRTAAAIARQVGIAEDEHPRVILGRDLPDEQAMSDDDRRRILDTSVFARFSPEQKLNLVDVFQDAGHTAAMTGDGINDSPALKKADIGIAMGRRGTDAAREAADMVLADDAFASIVQAIRQGRVIFDNIRRSVMFMLCTNMAEVFAVAAAVAVEALKTGTAAETPLLLPLLPLQILYLNMLTDVLPALALGVGKGSDAVMHRPPRPHSESILTRRHWLAVGGWGLLIAACVLAALATGRLALRLEARAAVTMSFLTLGFSKLWFVYTLRRPDSGWWNNTIVRNPWIWGATGLCVVLLVAAVCLPGLSALLKTRSPGPAGWGWIFAFSAVPVLVGQAILAVRGRSTGARTPGRAP